MVLTNPDHVWTLQNEHMHIQEHCVFFILYNIFKLFFMIKFEKKY